VSTGRDWFGPRLPDRSRIQLFACKVGLGAMEVIFAGSLDLAYVGLKPPDQRCARSGETRSW
jgi:NitT/TauT family transport system substrate-binding protein